MSATPSSSKAPDACDKMYKIDNVGRKGKGMIAAQDLSPGDFILSEKPVLIVDSDGTQESVIYRQYLDLSKDDRDRFNDLTYHATSEEITEYSKRCGKQQDKERGKLIARFETNCMEDSGWTKRYVAVECARMNHSCNPNTTYDYFHVENLVIVRALQKIARGEEILTTYVPPVVSTLLGIIPTDTLRHVLIIPKRFSGSRNGGRRSSGGIGGSTATVKFVLRHP